MKKILLYFAVGSLSLAGVSCQKKEDAPAPSALETEWDWVSSKGGITGGILMTPATTGTTQRYVFGPNSTFQQYRNGQLVQSSTYARANQVSLIFNAQRDMLSLGLSGANGTPAVPVRYIVEQLTAEVLVLDEDHYDGMVITFHKAAAKGR